MSHRTFYIIDGDVIINAVSARDEVRALEVARGLINGDRLRVDPNPPMAMLQRYPYWDRRP